MGEWLSAVCGGGEASGGDEGFAGGVCGGYGYESGDEASVVGDFDGFAALGAGDPCAGVLFEFSDADPLHT